LSEPNVYDLFEYPGYSFPDTHPDRLAVMAALHGVPAAPVENCRVLEIGCGEGANLIPMAQALPSSQFTGFDLAANPVARGQKRARLLGLSNLRLFQADLADVGPEDHRGALGKYDYVIAHGLYAWVAEPLRDKLLALCAEHLAENGVAFLSYNAWPGSHIRNMFRDALRWSTTGAPQGPEEVAGSLDLIEALIQARAADDPWRRLFEDQIAKMRKRAPNITLHDELAPAFAPVWFSAFVRHARSHGLEYLADAQLPVPTDPAFRPELMTRIRTAAGDDPIDQEDMLDFTRMRMYRETLLVRAPRTLRREPDPGALTHMLLASQAVAIPGEHSEQRLYAIPGGTRVALNQGPAIAAMEMLIAAWPRALSFDEVSAALRAHGLPQGAQPNHLLLQMAIARLIELHQWQPAVVNFVSERPEVPALCRHEAALRPYTPNLWHAIVQLDDPVLRTLLLLMDGSRTRSELLAALVREFPATPETELDNDLDEHLERLRHAALLCA